MNQEKFEALVQDLSVGGAVPLDPAPLAHLDMLHSRLPTLKVLDGYTLSYTQWYLLF